MASLVSPAMALEKPRTAALMRAVLGPVGASRIATAQTGRDGLVAKTWVGSINAGGGV